MDVPLSDNAWNQAEGSSQTQVDMYPPHGWKGLQECQFGNPTVNYKTDLPCAEREENAEMNMKIRRAVWSKNEVFSKSN